MFDRFLAAFTITARPAKDPNEVPIPAKVEPESYRFLMGEYGGATFDHGLYRLRAVPDIAKWNGIVGDAFPEYVKRISCFGYDWLGRHFVLDSSRIDGGQSLVLMLEPGTGEVLEIPTNFVMLHDDELVDYADAALAKDFYARWRKGSGARELSPDQCVGYKVPLFLGGADEVDNLEVIDAEVYWALCGQLRQGTRHLAPGTTIRSATIS
jgi:hypothetical protein